MWSFGGLRSALCKCLTETVAVRRTAVCTQRGMLKGSDNINYFSSKLIALSLNFWWVCPFLSC